MAVTVPPEPTTPAALGATVGSAAFVASYAAQRLWAAWSSGEDWTQLVAQYDTPYFWRAALALLHAVVAGSAAALAASPELAATALRFAPIWVPAVVLPLALSMALVP